MTTLTETAQSAYSQTADAIHAAYEGTSTVFYRSFLEQDKPAVVVAGKGIELTLDDGCTIIDAVGGPAVSCLGNGDERIHKAINDQLNKFAFVYSVPFTHESGEALCQKLIDTSDGAFVKAGIVCGGSEAMEGVIKMIRQYWVEVKEPHVVSLSLYAHPDNADSQRVNYIGRNMSYHGNCMGGLALAYHPTRRAIYEPIIKQSTFHHVSPAYKLRYGHPGETDEEYTQRLKDELEAKFVELGPDTVAAFVAETVVGATSGVSTPPKGYFKAMKEVCDKYGALFVLDEVMAGMGRMGTLHAWQTWGDGAVPDIQAVAKGIGSGYVPLGAILAGKRVSDAISKGSGLWIHGHTYQAHPVCCAVGKAVLDIFESDNLLENARSQGVYLEKLLRQELAANPVTADKIAQIRGSGMWWGIELCQDDKTLEPFPATLKPRMADRVIKACLDEQGLSILGFSGGIDGKLGDHLILAPAYTLTSEQVETIVSKLVKGLESAIKSCETAV